MRRRMFLNTPGDEGEARVRVIFSIVNSSGNTVTNFFANEVLRITTGTSEHDTTLGDSDIPTSFAVGKTFQKIYNITETIKPNSTVKLSSLFARGKGAGKKCVLEIKKNNISTGTQIGYADGYLGTTITDYDPYCEELIINPGDLIVIAVRFTLN